MRSVLPHLDRQCNLKARISQGVEPGQKSERFLGQQHGNADVNTKQQLEAALTERQPAEMQMVLEGEPSGHPLEKTVAQHKRAEQKTQIDEGHRIEEEDPEKAADKEEDSRKDKSQASSDSKGPPEHPQIVYEAFRIHMAGSRA